MTARQRLTVPCIAQPIPSLHGSPHGQQGYSALQVPAHISGYEPTQISQVRVMDRRRAGSVCHGSLMRVDKPAASEVSGPRQFEVRPGEMMDYFLFVPPGYDPRVPIPFLVSISGTGQQHVNGFSHRLPSANWAVAVPLRPQTAPLFFEGHGVNGDGVWYLMQFCQHLMESRKVERNAFVFCGVSNGGSAVLRFATIFPKLCRGVVVVTGSVHGLCPDDELKRLSGVPIDAYVGTLDECGFYAPMKELEMKLHILGQSPPFQLTIFEGGGHVCSPFIDTNVLKGKIKLMLLRTGPPGLAMKLGTVRPTSDGLGRLSRDEVIAQLNTFGANIGLSCSFDDDGGLVVCNQKRDGTVHFDESCVATAESPSMHDHVKVTTTSSARFRRSKTVDFSPSHAIT
eukprot:TRINITY_DN67851_c0_g1_i1.p1 TRINITY_DN67851_c0_g1~~TRINITY_DN67851_c0_g1_i1.p1  ORF type:complete len:398 (+),score=43.72 TRINITY_DN67851_c0_g1_i1:36-1229(+)